MEEETATRPKEPSFQGRLQLKDFMFVSKNNCAATSTMKRSSSGRSIAAPSPPGEVVPSRASPKTSTLKAPSSSLQPRKRKADEPKPTTTTTTKRQKGGGYAPPSTYAHLPLLPDAMAPRLLILFIGLNPGVQTARTGHAYAHPSNLFWKLLRASGLTAPAPAPVHPWSEDGDLPARYGLGLTNIVARPSRSGAELRRAELDDGVDALDAKCARWRPEVACLVGKGIWESVARVRARRRVGCEGGGGGGGGGGGAPAQKKKKGEKKGDGEFRYGWQDEDVRMGAVEDENAVSEGGRGRWEGARVFVASSTSGLAATLRPEEKERIWKELGDWCMRRRKERAEETEEGKEERG
ncbi:uracil DNA N-glycosylase Thp1 [Diatrype stigma]|uniref:Uracil DNA N-glycosylase Thp1 n=1 Tax=Diatrype stigma TaxID=117547 RepID=A0AAN9UZ10_9PEZI